MLQAKDHEAVAGILEKLVRYTVDHFSREEAIWAEGGLRGQAEHKQLHAKLAGEVAAFQKDFMAGKAMVTAELMSFLRDWLINHVFKADKAGMKEISARG